MKIISAVFLISFMVFTQNAQAQTVNLCDDDGEWAPYSYHPRINGLPDKSKIIGYAVDMVAEISKLSGLEFNYVFSNWKRCNYYVEIFDKTNKFEAFINGSFSQERAEKYYLTTPIYKTHIGVFYLKSKYPNGLDIRKPYDLSRYKICGIFGHDYDSITKKYDFPADFKINKDADKTKTVFGMVLKSRCDAFISSIEPIYGGAKIGQYTIPDDIASMPIPKIETNSFHIFITKKSPRSFELLTKINQAILILHNNGVAQKLLDKYFPAQ